MKENNYNLENKDNNNCKTNNKYKKINNNMGITVKKNNIYQIYIKNLEYIKKKILSNIINNNKYINK